MQHVGTANKFYGGHSKACTANNKSPNLYKLNKVHISFLTSQAAASILFPDKISKFIYLLQ